MAVASTAPNTIHLGGEFRREEGKASAALSPGHIVEIVSTGKWQKRAAAGGYGERAVAVEDALQGKTIADAYAADDLVSINIYAPGGEAFVFLSDGENVVIGDLLEVGGTDGELIKRVSGIAIAVATEAKDLSASGNTAAAKIRVRFI